MSRIRLPNFKRSLCSGSQFQTIFVMLADQKHITQEKNEKTTEAIDGHHFTGLSLSLSRAADSLAFSAWTQTGPKFLKKNKSARPVDNSVSGAF